MGVVSFNTLLPNDYNKYIINSCSAYSRFKMINILDFNSAINQKKCYHSRLSSAFDGYYPSWDQLITFMDQSFLSGNKRARDPHKIWCGVKDKDFMIVPWIKKVLAETIKIDVNKIDCQIYAGFSPNAFASPPHADPMNVFFVTMQGKIPWKIFENGCDYNNKTRTMTSKSTFSQSLKQGDFVYIPIGVYHAAYPNSSRVGFSFGWKDKI